MRKGFLIFSLIAIATLIGVNIYLSKVKTSQPTSQPSGPESPTGQRLIDQSSVIPPVEASQVTSMDSPDGKLTLMMKTVKNQNEIIYSFTVSGKEIFTKTTDLSTVISIPGNSWSPNNKYVFLKESGSSGPAFFALSATVLSSEQNDQTANITNLFSQKYPDLSIGDVTGWGGMNLIIVNSAKSDGSRGPSFWFEMPGRGFIQLSTRF